MFPNLPSTTDQSAWGNAFVNLAIVGGVLIVMATFNETADLAKAFAILIFIAVALTDGVQALSGPKASLAQKGHIGKAALP